MATALLATVLISFTLLGAFSEANAQDRENILLNRDFSSNNWITNSQVIVTTLDFEVDGNGADWSWETFENTDNPPLEFIDNPDATGINETAKVAKFTARADGQPWAGTRGTGGTPFLFDEVNRTITIMVWKPVISNVGIKLETASNWSQGEIVVANTKVNEWEAITIDFTGRENPPGGEAFNGISVFPDFNMDGRGQENVIYFDNISFEGFVASSNGGGGGDAPTTAAPTPTQNAESVLSVFNNTYIDIDGTNYNPDWGQSTQVSFEVIGGSNTMKYANFNYQGTEFASAVDASEMTHIHIHMWTPDATTVNFTPISPGQEKLYALSITPGEWVSYNIPLSFFDNVNLSDIIQFKFDGGNGSQTLFLDNIFFYQSEGGAGEDVATLDFEEGGNGADWNWLTFENADNPPLVFIDNPDATGINESAKVAEFTARADGNPWAGTRGTGETKFLFNETNRTISIMVWKTVISDIGIKLETASNWAQPEIKVANTKVNEWEEIVIDFTGRENPPNGEAFNGISVFPDFNMDGRGQENVIYFDNIAFTGFVTVEGDNGNGGDDNAPTTAAPTPTQGADDVISVFSNAYTDVEGTNLNPGWGQSTLVTFVDIEGSNTMKYANFNYQGTELTPAIDASGMTHIHIDMWTPDNEAVNFTVISPGPQEKLFALDITPGEWVSYDIPLSYFDNVNLAEIFQLKFEGGNGSQTLFLDNIFFYDEVATSIDDVNDRPAGIELKQNYPNPFNPTTQIQFALPDNAPVRLEVYNIMGQRVATLVDSNMSAGSHTVTFNANAFASGIYIYRLQTGDKTLIRQMTLIK
jgi:hypothetical protein